VEDERLLILSRQPRPGLSKPAKSTARMNIRKKFAVKPQHFRTFPALTNRQRQ
jgi:hypothetical protein